MHENGLRSRRFVLWLRGPAHGGPCKKGTGVRKRSSKGPDRSLHRNRLPGGVYTPEGCINCAGNVLQRPIPALFPGLGLLVGLLPALTSHRGPTAVMYRESHGAAEIGMRASVGRGFDREFGRPPQRSQ